MNSKSNLRWLFTVAAKQKWSILVITLIQVVIGGSSILYAFVLKNIIDAAVANNSPLFVQSAIFVLVLTLFQIISSAISRYLSELSRSGMENAFKLRLFETLLNRDYVSVTSLHSGEWMNRLTSDTSTVADGMTSIIPNLAGMASRLISGIIGILYLEPLFATIILPGGLLLMAITYSFRKLLKKLHKEVRTADGKVRIFLQERLEAMMMIRTFDASKQTVNKAQDIMKEHQDIRIKRVRFTNISNIGYSMAMQLVYLFGVIYCGYKIMIGLMSYGTLMAIMQLISRVQSPIVSITGIIPQYFSLTASAERLREAEEYAKEIENSISENEIVKYYNNEFLGIKMEHGTFSYQKNDGSSISVIKDFDLQINKGQYVALVGPSGCGKSTTLKFLLGLYHLDNGELNLCSKEGKQKLTTAHIALFSYVPQGNMLMSGTIREVVAFDDPDKMKQEEKIYQALTIACADEFVSALPDKIETMLGENGAGLSEGQMQRIAIARAIFSDHPILILDEATSSLDEETEKKLLENLHNMTDKTVLIVTHRPAALAICDSVIRMGDR